MTPPLKWHGGKHYLAPKLWEIAKRVPHVHRVEPYFGGGSFTLASDPKGYSEVANDLNGNLYSFWLVMQREEYFAEFKRRVDATPFGEELFRNCRKNLAQGSFPTDVDAAFNFFICCRQSMSGRMKDFAPLSRNRVRRGMNEQASAWMTCVDGLSEVHQRLRRVVILNRDALEVIRQQDGPQTLFYLDPPYLHATRATTGEYAHEMTSQQHEDLLALLSRIQGKFMLSGYASDLYSAWESHHKWQRLSFDLPNNAAGGDTKRRMTEVLWCNFNPETGT